MAEDADRAVERILLKLASCSSGESSPPGPSSLPVSASLSPSHLEAIRLASLSALESSAPSLLPSSSFTAVLASLLSSARHRTRDAPPPSATHHGLLLGAALSCPSSSRHALAPIAHELSPIVPLPSVRDRLLNLSLQRGYSPERSKRSLIKPLAALHEGLFLLNGDLVAICRLLADEPSLLFQWESDRLRFLLRSLSCSTPQRPHTVSDLVFWCKHALCDQLAPIDSNWNRAALDALFAAHQVLLRLDDLPLASSEFATALSSLLQLPSHSKGHKCAIQLYSEWKRRLMRASPLLACSAVAEVQHPLGHVLSPSVLGGEPTSVVPCSICHMDTLSTFSYVTAGTVFEPRHSESHRKLEDNQGASVTRENHALTDALRTILMASTGTGTEEPLKRSDTRNALQTIAKIAIKASYAQLQRIICIACVHILRCASANESGLLLNDLLTRFERTASDGGTGMFASGSSVASEESIACHKLLVDLVSQLPPILEASGLSEGAETIDGVNGLDALASRAEVARSDRSSAHANRLESAMRTIISFIASGNVSFHSLARGACAQLIASYARQSNCEWDLVKRASVSTLQLQLNGSCMPKDEHRQIFQDDPRKLELLSKKLRSREGDGRIEACALADLSLELASVTFLWLSKSSASIRFSGA